MTFKYNYIDLQTNSGGLMHASVLVEQASLTPNGLAADLLIYILCFPLVLARLPKRWITCAKNVSLLINSN